MQTKADGKKLLRGSLIAFTVLFGTTALTLPLRPAFALSELRHEQGVAQQKPAEEEKAAPAETEQDGEEASPLELPLPDPIVRKINAAIKDALAAPDVQKALREATADPIYSTPEQMLAFVQKEAARWSTMINK